jgi:phosphatidate cytidylyltransferase
VINVNRNDTGAGANAAGNGDARNFKRRVTSACIMAPVGLLLVYIGGWLFLLACLIVAGIILWEWTMLVARTADMRVFLPGAIALIIAALLSTASEPGAAFGMVVLGAILAGGFIAIWPRHFPATDPLAWCVGGVVYAGIALIPTVTLRSDPDMGFAALLFLFATVWATDVLAYLTGRAMGGPLLWPELSPKKTWAGAIGGLAGGVAAGTPVAYAIAGTEPVVAGVLALVLSIVAQGGDLFESAIKRRFDAKDAGNLIPGHGGAMDRLDGYVAAALIALLIGALHRGTGAAGQGLLVW